MRTRLALICLFAIGWSAPARAESPANHLSILGWLNRETRQADLVVLGEVAGDAYPDAQTGKVKAVLGQCKVFNGPRLGRTLRVLLKPAMQQGRYMVPSPLLRGQWALLFLRNQGGQWVGAPLGRVVETPFHGLTFFAEPGLVIDDASPGISWRFVLDSLSQLVATRLEIIDGHLPALRAAATREQRERIKLAIEWQVQEQLGLPVP